MEKKILATIEEAVHNGDTAGANVLVIKDGKESAYCGYGMRDIENRLPIERDTIFRLYSQTKPITAAAAVSLMEKGKLDAGAWLSDYLPEYAVSYVRRNGERVPAHKHITVGDLLNRPPVYRIPARTARVESTAARFSGRLSRSCIPIRRSQRLNSRGRCLRESFALSLAKGSCTALLLTS